MIPPFNDDGCLPPGVHPATLDENGFVNVTFATDRWEVAKGMIEVIP